MGSFLSQNNSGGRGSLKGHAKFRAHFVEIRLRLEQRLPRSAKMDQGKEDDCFEEAEEQGKNEEMGCLEKNLAEQQARISPEWMENPSPRYKREEPDAKDWEGVP